MPEPVRFAALPDARPADFLAFLESLTRQNSLTTWANSVFLPELIDYLDSTTEGEQRIVNRIVPVAPILAMMPGAPATAGIDAHLIVRLVQRVATPAQGEPMDPGYVPAVLEPSHWQVDLVTTPSPSGAYPAELIPPLYSAAINLVGTPALWTKESGGTANAVEINGEGWPAPWHMVDVVSPDMLYGVAGEVTP